MLDGGANADFDPLGVVREMVQNPDLNVVKLRYVPRLTLLQTHIIAS